MRLSLSLTLHSRVKWASVLERPLSYNCPESRGSSRGVPWSPAPIRPGAGEWGEPTGQAIDPTRRQFTFYSESGREKPAALVERAPVGGVALPPLRPGSPKQGPQLSAPRTISPP